MAKKKVTIITTHSYCEQNIKYYSKIERYFKINDWKISDGFKSELYVFVGCGASDDRLDTLKELHEMFEKKYMNIKKLVVMGCLPKTHAEELAVFYQGEIIEFGKEHLLDEIINSDIKFEDVENTNVFRPLNKNYIFYKNPIYHIQIERGCLKQCTYCLINKACGDIQSIDLDEIIREFKKGLGKGYNDFYLFGTDLFAYGYDISSNIIELMNKLLSIKQTVNFYLGNLHVRWLMDNFDGLIDLCSSGHIKSIQIALQHIDDEILQRMGRPTKFSEIYPSIYNLRQANDELFMSTDFIVGFPGETDEKFNKLYGFISEDKCFDMIQHFIYSDNKGAASYKYDDKVRSSVKIKRWHELNSVIGERSPGKVFRNLSKLKKSNIYKYYRDVYNTSTKTGYFICKKTYFT